MDTLGMKLARVVKQALADTRNHLDESDPQEFKIELEENVADQMVQANLSHHSYTLVVTGSGNDLFATLSVIDESGDMWHGSNRSNIDE